MPSVAKGFHVNPCLPMNFDNTPNHSRPASHSNWWGIPYIVTRKNDQNEVVSYEVRRLDGGAWDRSTNLGQKPTLDEAVKLCQRVAEDEMFECSKCQAATLALYSGPMGLLENNRYFNVVICPVCGFIASKEEADQSNPLHKDVSVDQ